MRHPPRPPTPTATLTTFFLKVLPMVLCNIFYFLPTTLYSTYITTYSM
jgi:hypothetical protein